MRPTSLGLVIAALVLAGCGGVPFVDGGEDPTTDVTPVPGDQLSVPSPPGVASNRVMSPTTLGLAHARAIENVSYVLDATRTVRHANGTLRSRLAVRVALDDDRTFHVDVSTGGPEAPVFLGEPPAEAVYWSDGTTYLRRLTRDGETTYVASDPPGTWIGTWSYWTNSVPFGGGNGRPATFFASLFSSVPTRVTGSTSVENVTVLRVTNRVDRPFSDEAFPGDVRSVRDVSLVALVDDDGLVRSLDLRYAGSVEGEPVLIHRTVRYEAVGSTDVERPSWYERATNGPVATTVSDSRSGDTG